jgi:hypothetical protein
MGKAISIAYVMLAIGLVACRGADGGGSKSSELPDSLEEASFIDNIDEDLTELDAHVDAELIADEGTGDLPQKDDDTPEPGGSLETEQEALDPPGCNGHAALCGRRFDEVAYATTHNAMANKADGFIGPNHMEDVPTQLADGVRGLMLDIHMHEGEVALCHANCDWGMMPLVEGLGQIRDFMEAHPREVLTILFETYVSNEDTGAAFVVAGLEEMLHAQITGEPWPTLQEMIDSGRRLVVFTDHQSETYPWLHRTWDHCFDTNWAAKTLEDFSCDRLRGAEGNPLFILNHFLTDPLPFPYLAEQANANPFFIERALECQLAHETLPNFVTVDFYAIGDVFDVVDSLNGL